jgi:hypothetical protein
LLQHLQKVVTTIRARLTYTVQRLQAAAKEKSIDLFIMFALDGTSKRNRSDAIDVTSAPSRNLHNLIRLLNSDVYRCSEAKQKDGRRGMKKLFSNEFATLRQLVCELVFASDVTLFKFEWCGCCLNSS